MASPHHHLVVVIAGGVCLLLVILLVALTRKRSSAPPEQQEDDQAKRIEERLATGRFSRAPSSWRRKAVVVETAEDTPVPETDKSDTEA